MTNNNHFKSAAFYSVLLRMIVLLFACPLSVVNALEIKIGLYNDQSIVSAVFSVVEGNYNIIGDGNIILNVSQGEIFYLSPENGTLQFTGGDKKFPGFRAISVEKTTEEGVLQLKPVAPLLPSADYDGNLTISLVNGELKIINLVEMDHYIAGVIEAEGGSNAGEEYYKAQAILIRTYALRNMHRHAAQSFNLCSSEHCQAYKGKSLLNRQIYEATHATDNLIITDIGGNLAIAPYHSNCGGITSTSDMVWQRHHYYLLPVSDIFCSKGNNYTWTKKITLTRWKNYLSGYGINTARLTNEAYNIRHPNREKYITINDIPVPTRSIREEFGLKSTFFKIEKAGNEIIFIGKGFGHGVGMCQEGAMEMARMGYTYVDILHYYYQHIEIAPLVEQETTGND
ncbi:MAG: SpoIID/LytB domain-containing protein [Bacteroidales bacterium]